MAENGILDAVAARPPYFGTVLKAGGRGPDVAQVQVWLNGVRGQWAQLPVLTVDGRFGSGTETAVKEFQALVGLKADGKVGASTWNALYNRYADAHGAGEVYPGITLLPGAHGAAVRSMQQKLARASATYTALNKPEADGTFGLNTSAALRRFQREFGLATDGLAGAKTWAKLAQVEKSLAQGQPMPSEAVYPGRVLRQGATGDAVRMAQSWLAALGGGVPKVRVDGIYGASTRQAVLAFQAKAGLKLDGAVGKETWQALRTAFNQTL